MNTGEGKSFGFSEIKNFDEHIAREIKGYDILDSLVCDLADAFLEDGTNVYDIGCSTGRLINKLASRVASDPDVPRIVKFVGLEPNSNLTNDFVPFDDQVHIVPEKVTTKSTFENASLITSIFTLQFTPTRHRPFILKNIHDGLNHNGAFIWAEKVHASDPKIESLLDAQHIAFKREGSSADDILDKNRRLRALMRPLDLATNTKMLQDAGFERFETFWRVNNFVGIVAIKSY